MSSFPIVYAGRIPAHVESYVLRKEGDRTEAVLLSILGSSTAVGAVWASLVKGDDLAFVRRDEEKERDRKYLAAMTTADGERIRYRLLRREIPQYRQVHAVVIAEVALPGNASPEKDFVVFVHETDTEEAFLSRFKASWDRAVTRPALDSWTERLFSKGRASGLVRDLPSDGCRAVSVAADPERWEQIVSNLARGSSGRKKGRREKEGAA